MNLQQRINLLKELGKYLSANGSEWQQATEKAERENGWFTQEFIQLAVSNITEQYLHPGRLEAFAAAYQVPAEPAAPRRVGLVAAGNIPLVGFHDWLCIFLSGHHTVIKPSSKDQVLISHLLGKLAQWVPEAALLTQQAEMLKGCDAYIATGSNNSARYFDYYFGKYPHIIRRNRTSVAILDGSESAADLEALADDVHQYFGLGCRNVTKTFVPAGYDFVPLLNSFRKYGYFSDHNKYRNNYDYQLALLMLNNKYYMTNDSLLLVEADAVFSPVSQLNFSFYSSQAEVLATLTENNDIQCIVGKNLVPFGQAQRPSLGDFADGVDTMKFLQGL
ncbi:MAG TPA: hypothetical protein VLD19_21935 [Chitinophagaceae bacterium]|nr:hypothetical protein [Chitinophagaceae bacterium]